VSPSPFPVGWSVPESDKRNGHTGHESALNCAPPFLSAPPHDTPSFVQTARRRVRSARMYEVKYWPAAPKNRAGDSGPPRFAWCRGKPENYRPKRQTPKHSPANHPPVKLKPSARNHSAGRARLFDCTVSAERESARAGKWRPRRPHVRCGPSAVRSSSAHRYFTGAPRPYLSAGCPAKSHQSIRLHSPPSTLPLPMLALPARTSCTACSSSACSRSRSACSARRRPRGSPRP
jgi:hypothetical protein